MSIQQQNPVSTEEAVHNFSHAIAGIATSLKGLVKFAAEKQQSSTGISTGIAHLGKEQTALNVLASVEAALALTRDFTSGAAPAPQTTAPTKTVG